MKAEPHDIEHEPAVAYTTPMANMGYRTLGRTGVRVSQLAMGTMSFGGDADEAEAGRMYAACRDAGINLFDTADAGPLPVVVGATPRDGARLDHEIDPV